MVGFAFLRQMPPFVWLIGLSLRRRFSVFVGFRTGYSESKQKSVGARILGFEPAMITQVETKAPCPFLLLSNPQMSYQWHQDDIKYPVCHTRRRRSWSWKIDDVRLSMRLSSETNRGGSSYRPIR